MSKDMNDISISEVWLLENVFDAIAFVVLKLQDWNSSLLQHLAAHCLNRDTSLTRY